MSSPPTPESGHETDAESTILNPVKPEAAAEVGKGGGAHINIKVTSQTAPDVLFRLKHDAKMEIVINRYCSEHSLNPEAVVFLNDGGKHIKAAQTAEEAGVEDGSSISVHLNQEGGSGRASV
jgi:small ubiquitin-related modifier